MKELTAGKIMLKLLAMDPTKPVTVLHDGKYLPVVHVSESEDGCIELHTEVKTSELLNLTRGLYQAASAVRDDFIRVLSKCIIKGLDFKMAQEVATRLPISCEQLVDSVQNHEELLALHNEHCKGAV